MGSRRGPRVPHCRRCGHPNDPRRASRGLCLRCYEWAQRTGQLADFERVNRTRDELLEDLVVLRRSGCTLQQVAARLGMAYPSLERALVRARRAGDPRAITAGQDRSFR